MNSGAGTRSGLWRASALIASLWLLNALLTFHNVWPTVFIRPSGELSIELAILLLILAAWQRLRGALPRRLLIVLAALFVLGAIGRYAEVTAPALYGREVNLYWDLPHVGALTGMLARVASPWLLILGTIGVLAGFALLYYAALCSWQRIANELQSPSVSIGASVVAIAVIIGFTLENIAEERPRIPRFSMPIAKTYGEQFAKVGTAMLERGTTRRLPPSPALSSTLSLIDGSDVMVVFVESYGRVAYDNREFFAALAPSRAELADAVRDTGRSVISGYVESPTFGGGSWLSHLNFLTGVEVSEYSRAQLLMTQTRRNFGHALAEHGYRRVGLMPGLKLDWPEGVFYDFDRIYDDAALGYDGPAFGWWRIPDQFSLARLDVLERSDAGTPLFIFFPTVSTHTPFRPTPPYQSDWSRMLSTQPFDAAPLQHSLAQLPDWGNLAESYKSALSYSLQTLAGYLRTQARDDLILIVIGDHQPPAVVSGPNAPWDVPVHVIASKTAVLKSLAECGFVAGLIPAPHAVGRMHQLGPALLRAFESTEVPTKCPLQPGDTAPGHTADRS
ncbi:MAG TPA: sulfatase-like hydrolase/transferase [Steroidobacter sp.]|uniref:sulfatase-like hydrolase/transferase n=1 Tax=Steroidobacter sp. TaxID=1978227 RepID=UPI002ED99636